MELSRCLRDPWDCLDSLAVEYACELRRSGASGRFKLSSVSQQLAIWIESFSYLLVNLYILFRQDRICYVTQFSILLQIKLELNMLSIRNADD